ncbi:MAG: hypothetical protein WC756_10900 [Taibaiella sp.]|jgi:hypothetical protein
MNNYYGLVLSAIFLSGCGCYEFASSIKKNVTPMHFNGKVENKYLDSTDRMAPKVTLEDGKVYPIYAYEMYDDLQPRDSITKDAGTLKYVLVRDGQQKVYYPKCDGKEIK